MIHASTKGLLNPFQWLLMCSFVASSVGAESVAEQTSGPGFGPEKGWLVLEGGGKLRNTEVLKRFVSLAGGAGARLVEIPTAAIHNMGSTYDSAYMQRQTQWIHDVFGISDIAILHTYDRREADQDTFVQPLRRATAVWIEGGDHETLIDAYVGTQTEREIKQLIGRGGVVGGTSAGAMVLASFVMTQLPRASTNELHLDPSRLQGFGLLKASVVDPHFFNRHREKDLPMILALHPDLLGVGIDETTAGVIHGDTLDVIGEGRVAIFDGKPHEGKEYLSLSNGQRLDLKTRTLSNWLHE
jgi:cyanophycinase